MRYIFFLCLLYLPLLLPGESTPQRRLQNLRVKLKQQRKKIKELKGKESSILQSIQEIDNEIYLNRNLISELKREEANTEEQIKFLGNKIERLSTRLTAKKKILARRLREIYKYGEIHPIEIILLSHSFDDAVKRVKYLILIAQQDQRVYREILRISQILKDEKETVVSKLKKLKIIRKEAENEGGNLLAEKENKKRYLSSTKSQREDAEKLAVELRQSERDLQKLIASLEERKKKRKGITYFDTHKGKIMMPAEGKIVGKFGFVKDLKYGTTTKNNGIDIKAPWGEDVYAVYSGKVVYADNFLGYGKVVLIDHDDGYYTLYGHLSSIAVVLGNDVLMGDIVGKVGDTGSTDFPELHFEIRKHGKPVNPLIYLKR